MKSTAFMMALLVAASFGTAHAQAQVPEYPTKPIRLIVSTAPGGLMDIPGRLYSEYADRTGAQRIVVENRGGAGGNLGVEAVAKAAPDGYTLGLIQLGNVAINPFLF